MTDERTQELPGVDRNEIDRSVDAPMDPDRIPGDPEATDESNRWLRDGADAPDAADIEDPDQQR